MSEFASDEKRAEHIAALVREQEGYKARVAHAEADGDADRAAVYAARRDAVADELRRLAADVKPKRRRAESRKA